MTKAGALLDGTGVPTVREAIVRLMRCARLSEIAIANVRLAGIDLGPSELHDLGVCRLLIAGLDAGFLADAEAVRCDPARIDTLRRLLDFARSGCLEVRCAALARWTPDFSIYHFGVHEPPALLLGAHYFYEANGSPLTAVLRDEQMARRASRRFNRLWADAYDVLPAIAETLADAIDDRPVAAGHAAAGRARHP